MSQEPPTPATPDRDAATLPPQPPGTPVAGVSAERLTVLGYEILGELGRGGMGVVYQARQTALNRLVALKMILAGSFAGEEQRARFRIEAEAVARLQHPNIVQIYEVDEHDGLPCCSLEYVAGDLLAPSSARMYFQRLEGATVRVLGPRRSARAAYLYMSMIVEFRALWFYGLYDQALKRARHAMSLKRVLGEEQAHLGDMTERLEAGNELDGACAAAVLAAERKLYSRLLGALEGAA